MNRKIAVAAIVGGFVHAVGLLRGQEPQTRVPRTPVGQPVSPTISGTVSPTQAEDLQRQINELAKRLSAVEQTLATQSQVDAVTKNQLAEVTNRLSAVEQTQANTVGFTKSGNDLTLSPAGKVTIKPAAGLSLQGPTIDVTATGNLVQKAGMILLN